MISLNQWANIANQDELRRRKGKNLTTKDSYFTSIETLYEMNIEIAQFVTKNTQGMGTNRRGRDGSENLQNGLGHLKITLTVSMTN